MRLLVAFFLLLMPSISMAATGPLINAATLAITSGGAWQTLFAQNTNRSALLIENPCSATTQGIGTAESLFVSFGSNPGSSTTTGAFELAPCGSMSLLGTPNYVSTQIVYVYAATTSHAFIASQTQ